MADFIENEREVQMNETDAPETLASLGEALSEEEICRIVGTKNVMGTCSG